MLFPEPLTPVTATKQRSGNTALNPCKLFALAPLMTIASFDFLLTLGVAISNLPVRYAAVSEL